jgi:hypothetical protein
MTDSSEAQRRFIALVPPPPRIMMFDWTATEAALGVALPSDYKWLVDLYGSGEFGSEVVVWVPGAPVDLIANTEIAMAELADCRGNLARRTWRNPDGTQTPVDIGDTPTAMPYVPWGANREGMYGYWHTTTDDPDTWPIMFANFRADEYLHHPGPLVECLYDLITAAFAAEEFGGPLDPVFTPIPFEITNNQYLRLRTP